MAWDLGNAYDAFPRIEEEFGEALDVSLNPRGSEYLFELVDSFGLGPGAVAVDVGCGEGDHAAHLARHFGLSVIGIDPVRRHIDVCRERFPEVRFELGTADRLPFADGAVDLVWCRDVLVHVADLDAAYAEFRRVLSPGGRILVYQMFGTDLLEPRERGWLFETMGVVDSSGDPATTAKAIAAANLRIERQVELTSEFGEYAQERDGMPGRKLVRAARLRRRREEYVAKYGQMSYDMMLGDCLWHVYAMIGKLTRRVYVLTHA